MATEIVCAGTESVGIAHASTHYTHLGLGGEVGEPASVEPPEPVPARLVSGGDFYVTPDGDRVAVEPATCSRGAGTITGLATPGAGNPPRGLASC